MKVTTDACLFGAWVAAELTCLLPAAASSPSSLQKPAALDIGTGTGLLSLQVAQQNEVQIEAVEIDKQAAEQASQNVMASPWGEMIRVLCTDVLQWEPEKKYDVIFSNPPFYQHELKSTETGKNIAHHDEGLKLEELLRFISSHLSSEGLFFLLLPAKRKGELEGLLHKNGLALQKVVQVQQTLKHQPFRLMIQGGRNNVKEVSQEQLSIRDNADAYTPAFASLLKPYYLYL